MPTFSQFVQVIVPFLNRSLLINMHTLHCIIRVHVPIRARGFAVCIFVNDITVNTSQL